MRSLPLSLRLKACADMVSVGNTAADVGCDHGWVAIYLVLMGICPGVIAVDLREGPLSAARRHVADYGLGGEIDLRLSDGLETIRPGEVNTLILLGMGGRLVLDILSRGAEVCAFAKELVLQPQSELPLVRRAIRGLGLRVLKEEIVLEEGKYYFPMKLECRGESFREWEKSLPKEETIQDRYGPLILEQGHPLLRGYLLREERRYRTILEALSENAGEAAEGRRREIEDRLKEVKALVGEDQSQNR